MANMPVKPKWETYKPEAVAGGFDNNLMRAKEYAYGVAKAVGKKGDINRDISKLATKADKAGLKIDDNGAWELAKVTLAYGDGLKKGQTLDQTFDDLAKKYPAKKK